MKYPVLIDSCVRGAGDDIYLHTYKNGHEFSIERIHADILNLCDGNYSLYDISKNVNLTVEEITDFLNVLEEGRLLKYNTSARQEVNFNWSDNPPFLREVHIDITGSCNLFGKCKHCYARSNLQNSQKDELTTSELINLIDQMGEMNVADCVISGGEPFLREDLPQIIKRLSANKIHLIGLFTNGTVYREEIFKTLKEENYKTFFFISLDGYDAETHEFMRGKGTFDKTIKFIEKVN